MTHIKRATVIMTRVVMLMKNTTRDHYVGECGYSIWDVCRSGSSPARGLQPVSYT